METLTALWEGLGHWAPAVALLAMTVIAVSVSKRVFKRAQLGAFHHQVAVAALLLLAAPAFVLVVPLPNESSRGQLLSLMGVLLSAAIALSSTTFVGNAMAGLLLRGIGNFKPGDFLEVESEFGRVVSRGLFHTEIQTMTRDLMTVPNLFLVTNPVKVVRSSGTIVHADVSLGYDVGRGDVEAQLLVAAEEAGLQESFVSVLELGDFSVVYRVSGLLKDTLKLITTRSVLRKCMLDALHRAGIEILSPRYQTTRALSSDDAIVPSETAAPPPPTSESARNPEAVIFDKAEEAATLERLNELHAEVSAQLAEAKGGARDVLLVRQKHLADVIEQRKDESTRD